MIRYYADERHVEQLAKGALRIIDMSKDKKTPGQDKDPEVVAAWRAGPWYVALFAFLSVAPRTHSSTHSVRPACSWPLL